jgi:hypothetical protein
MLVSMQDHQKNRERGTFALTKAPLAAGISRLAALGRPENRVVPAFACAKFPEIATFRRQLNRLSMFSTVFSTVVEILGNKPKGRSESESGAVNRKRGM